jgi:hypothetical protein
MSRLDAFRSMTAADVIECLAEDPSVLGEWQKEIGKLQADGPAANEVIDRQQAELTRLQGTAMNLLSTEDWTRVIAALGIYRHECLAASNRANLLRTPGGGVLFREVADRAEELADRIAQAGLHLERGAGL